MKIFKLLAPLFLCLLGTKTFAGHEVITDVRKGEEIKGATISVADQHLNSPSLDYTTVGRKAVVKLYHTDHLKQVPYYGWELQVHYTASLNLSAGHSTIKSGTLALEGDEGDHLIDTTIAQEVYESADSVQVVVDSVVFRDALGNNITVLPEDFYLEVQIVTERYFDLEVADWPIVKKVEYTYGDNSLWLGWTYLPGAEEYELEYVFVADGSLEDEHHRDTAIEYTFANATRINLSNNFYVISMAYPRGSIIYRVRGVGYDLGYPDFKNHRIYTRWSYEPADYTTRDAASDDATARCYYYTEGMEPEKNWTYTASYAEEGKRKEVLSFYDGSGRSRQQVTVNNSDNHAIVGETKYDHVGRPAVNILPVPVASEGLQFYGTETAPFNGNWDKGNFATDAHLDGNNSTLPEPLPAGSAAEDYYSSSNSLSFINRSALPTAGGYPYVITQHTNDGTERPVIQSGVGHSLRYKASGTGNTRYFYGNPTQSELDRLFGNEAGYAKYYKKNLITDANGQQTLQYLDARDRVVATTLSGEVPTNLKKLNGKTDSISTPLFDWPKDSVISDSIQESMNYAFSSPDSVKIFFGFDTIWLSTCWQPDSFSAAFDVSLTVATEGGDTVVDTTLMGLVAYPDDSLAFFLPASGNYTISRSISINEAYRDSIVAVEELRLTQNKYNPGNCPPFYELSADTLCDAISCDTACFESYSFVIEGLRYYTDTAHNTYRSLYADHTSYYLYPDSATTWSVSDPSAPFGIAVEACRQNCEGLEDTTGATDILQFFTDDRCKMKEDMMAFDIMHNVLDSLSCDTTGCYTLGTETNAGYIYQIKIYDFAQTTLLQTVFVDTNVAEPVATLCLGAHYGNLLKARVHYTEYNYYTTTLTYYSNPDCNPINVPTYDSIEDVDISYHPEYCAYEYFCNYSESCSPGTLTMDDLNIYQGVMYLPETYSEALNYSHSSTAYNLMNPLGLTSSGATGATADNQNYMMSGSALATDPIIDCNSGDTTTLTGYANYKLTELLKKFIPLADASGNPILSGGQQAYYSLWYLLDDPDDIATTDYSAVLDNAIIQTFESLHGASGCVPGAINNDEDKLRLFTSIYLFMREKVIYDYFDKKYSCSNTELLYTFWDGDADRDGWLDDGSGYRLVYPRNPLYEDYGEPLTTSDMYQTAEQETAGNAENVVATQLDTVSCSRFLSYIDQKGYDTTIISVPYAHSSAIATHLRTDFCVQFTAAQVDSVLLCATGTNYVYTAFLPDTLRASFMDFWTVEAQESCSERKMRQARGNAEDRWLTDKEAYLDSMEALYSSVAMDSILGNERMWMEYVLQEYHYTLYYYDQAGNLVKTVPPAGIHVLNQTEVDSVQLHRTSGEGTFKRPQHRYVTTYKYNSLNQVRMQWTPDGDSTHFWYDNAGRLVASQNARQRDENYYSYTLYDGVGRVCESGQISSSTDLRPKITSSQRELMAWVSAGSREQVVFTLYNQQLSDVPGGASVDGDILNAFGDYGQRYVRNRVASVFYISSISAGTPYIFGSDKLSSIPSDYLRYDNATHYSYDPHGNVSTLVQDIPELSGHSRRFFAMEYDYDLVSGNVNQVSYQKGKTDEFYHRYQYDADNRIKAVKTSRDGVMWDEDARYYYYPHGPLSRVELGDINVQGLDYAYTIQGWLKAVNSSSLGDGQASGTYDLGSDGEENSNHNEVFTPDALGFSLDYFSGDYSPLGSGHFLASVSAGSNPLDTGYRSLYNGNIGRMITALNNNVQDPIEVLAANYRYDQLNRLAWYVAYEDGGLNQNNSSSYASEMGHKAFYSYDPNGNISTLERYDQNGALMDDLSYIYDTNSVSGLMRNRLLQVVDSVGVVNGTDLDDQLADNYGYDAIGNLTGDVIESITNIEWNLQGKVTRIEKSTGDITFSYDAMGNRIGKSVASSKVSTWYVRDAQGNVMATYEDGGEGLVLKEQMIYGSDRLGSVDADIPVATGGGSTASGGLAIDPWLRYVVASQGSISGLDLNNGGADYVVTLQAMGDDISIPTASVVPIYGRYNTSGSNYVIPDGRSMTFSSSISVNLATLGKVAIISATGADLTAYNGNYTTEGNGRSRALGHKRYELKNHLGNVLGTVSDRKTWKGHTWEDELINSQFGGQEPGKTGLDLTEWTYTGELTEWEVSEEQLWAGYAEGAGFEHEINLEDGCYARYCLVFEELAGPLNVEIRVQNHNGTYLVVNQMIMERGEYCWDLQYPGVTDITVNLSTLHPGGFFVISEEYLTGASAPGWSALDDAYLPCYGYTEGGIKLYGDEDTDVVGLQKTVAIDPSCGQELCVEIPDLYGHTNLRVTSGGTTMVDEDLTEGGVELCFTFSGYDEVRIVLEVEEGYIVLGSVTLVSTCTDQWQVADVLTAQDYYPFGSTMPGRVYNSGNYRYGFNGMERDDEVKGNDNSLDFGERIYDPRIGRFLSIDPAYKDYPTWTPYLFAANDPLRYIDVDGLGPGDVVVIFPGAWVGEYIGKDGLSNTNVQEVLNNIKIAEAVPGGAMKAFASKYWGVSPDNPKDLDVATEAAYAFVKNNQGEDGQVVLYGFSWGGNLVQHLAKRLEEDGIEVDLLITVDQAGGPENDEVNREVSKNVKKNINIYQTVPEPITGSHGGKNKAEDKESTDLINNDYTGRYTGSAGEPDYEEVRHSNIHIKVQKRVEREAAKTINKNDG